MDIKKEIITALDTYKNYAASGENTSVDIFRDRTNALNERMESFIQTQGYTGKAEVSGTNLAYALLAYFDDIERIKIFHQINLVNEIKIHAYTAFWLLRKKPIQILEEFDQCESINEMFVTSYLMDFILKEKQNVKLSGVKKEQYDELLKTLYYTFKFRHFDAQMIELVLISFLAGFAVGASTCV
jgi:hypothetical protein